jgi:hypothetical protein
MRYASTSLPSSSLAKFLDMKALSAYGLSGQMDHVLVV